MERKGTALAPLKDSAFQQTWIQNEARRGGDGGSGGGSIFSGPFSGRS